MQRGSQSSLEDRGLIQSYFHHVFTQILIRECPHAYTHHVFTQKRMSAIHIRSSTILFKKNHRYHNVQETNRSQLTLTIHEPLQQPLQRSRSQPTRMKMQQKNNSGLGLGIACTQRINSGRWSNAYIACDSTGRLMEQSGNGLTSRMPVMGRNAAGVMADNPALIPLVRYNSRLITPMQMPIFIQII